MDSAYDMMLKDDRIMTERIGELLGQLNRIAEIIEDVDRRCMAVDGPVTPTLDEMTQDEISRIYALSKGKPEDWTP